MLQPLEIAIVSGAVRRWAAIAEPRAISLDPKIMGSGPVPASRQAFKRAGLDLAQMDLIEVNETFAAQYLAVEKEPDFYRSKVNVNGGLRWGTHWAPQALVW
jgi:acetyl-CoA acyltransferase 2